MMAKRKNITSQLHSRQGVLTSYFNTNTNDSGNKQRKKKNEAEVDKESRFKFKECPICFKCVPRFDLERHAEYCEGDRHVVPASRSGSCDQNQEDGDSILIEPSSQCAEEPLPGLFIYENFISEKEEQDILAYLDSEPLNPWKQCSFNGLHVGKRWGVHCDLRSRRVDAPQHPLPSFMQSIIMPKLLSLQPVKGCVPNESNAIDYRKSDGHYLKAHVDDRQLSKEAIANLSLAGDCIMTFRNVRMNKNLTQKHDPVKVLLKRRTLQILTGKARYDYSHGIECDDILSARRISLTMRESPLTNTSNDNIKQAFYNKKCTDKSSCVPNSKR